MAGPGQARFYSSTFVQTSLASGISAGATSFNVGVTTGAPGTPYVISVDQNSASEELMLVTNVSGLTLTVTRGVGGTAAVSHSTGASVVHVMYSQDLTDASAHIGAFDAVHGLSTGSLVVGTTDTQTMTNKTLTSPTITTPSITTPTITGTTTAGAINSGAITSTGAVQGVDIIATGLTGATQASRYVGATTSGQPGSGTFAQGDFIIDNNEGIVWICNTAGSPGNWIPQVNLSTAQTLSNKTINAGTFTGAGTGSGSLSLTSFVGGTLFAASGNTGAANATRLMGATAGGAPTSGTFNLGDIVVDQLGALWLCTVAGTPGTWVPLVAQVGPGSTTNIVTGGANKTAAQAPLHYTTSVSNTVNGSSQWSFTTSGVTFHGVGSVNVTPSDTTSSLGFLTLQQSLCSISGGNVTLGGTAYQPGGTGVVSSSTVKYNISVTGW